MNKTQSIFREIERNSSKKLNILYHNCHEEYDTRLSLTGNNFYCFNYNGVKPWQTKFRPRPDNFIELNGSGIEQLLPHVSIDLVLSGNKFGAWQVLSQVAKYLNVPIISIEHTASHFGINMLDKIHAMKSDVNVFISDWSIGSWGYSRDDSTVKVIKHGVNTDLFKPNDTKSISKPLVICNDYINRNYCLNYDMYVELAKTIEFDLWGDTKPISEPTRSLGHLVELYQTHNIFVNTSNLSPVPSVMLEAGSSECCIISTDNCAISEYFTHGHDCLLTNNVEEMREYIKLAQNDNELVTRLGKAARQTMETKFNLEKFVQNWNDTLWSVL